MGSLGRKLAAAAVMMFILAMGCGMSVYGAADSVTAEAYDKAVSLQSSADGLDAMVKETTMMPGQKSAAVKTITVKAKGLQNKNDMEVIISIRTDETEQVQYYKDGYYYTDQTGEKLKYKMEQTEMLELMNYYVYLNFDSGRLSNFTRKNLSDGALYQFSATEGTMGDYEDKILEGIQEEHKFNLVTLQGTMSTTSQDLITDRQLQVVYTVEGEDGNQTYIMNSEILFQNPGQETVVNMPDLSAYKEKSQKEAAVEITSLSQTVYATEDINIRAQNNLTAAILGGAFKGDALKETGYTSDGWIQIDLNGAAGYVYGEYVSTIKPVITVDMSGTMYATTVVNVRDAAGTAGTQLGSLSTGEAVTVTGYTDNGWIRVRYKGHTAYVSSSYLTWDEPVKVTSGYMSGTIADMTMNYMTIYSTQGGTYSFSTGDAYINAVDGMVIGDRVDVAYNNVGGSLTATQINNYTYHTQEEEDVENEMVYGIVMAYGMNAVTIACNDGSSMSIMKDSDTVVRGQVYVGGYISISYYYDSTIGGYRATYMSMV